MAEAVGQLPAAAAAPKPASSPATPTKQSSPAIPVGLNEAALDSPAYRASALHFAEQVDAIEKWLDGHVKSTSKLVHDMLALEEAINSYLGKIVPPVTAADGIIDHDFTLLALKRVGDGSREWWTQLLGSMRKMETISLDPVRGFISTDLKTFKEARRTLELSQKTFDTTLARYVAQSKAKEPSSLREDAFAVYETRKAYLKASMDYCQLAPQLRFALDKVLVRVCSDLWRDMKRSREISISSTKWGSEMDRLRGWSKEMESTEVVLKRELQSARRTIGESSLTSYKPSRELEDYSASTVPFLGSRGPVNVTTDDRSDIQSEKQGWLFLRTLSGKQVRPTWIRRWYYCRDGIFGWLVQGPHGVLQGDEIGVLLCSAKPAVQEERRFCFEIKTKSQNLMLQAETQAQLTEWLEVFEVAKKLAFETTMGRDSSVLPGGIDPAFSITAPSVPEFSAKSLETVNEDAIASFERSGTTPLQVPESNLNRASAEVGNTIPRRSFTSLAREDGESGREHAARIMQRLDLHRKGAAGAAADSSTAGGGIASLISASHNLLPSYTSPQLTQVTSPRANAPPVSYAIETPRGSLAPATLVKPPLPTVLSKAAVVVSAERALGASGKRALPTAIMANYWGSNTVADMYASGRGGTPGTAKSEEEDPFLKGVIQTTIASEDSGTGPLIGHRKTVSAGADLAQEPSPEKQGGETFPSNYPPELKTHHPQFRLLFPNVPLEEKLVMVFNAGWSSSSEGRAGGQGMAGYGRVYVTPDTMYLYGHQMGLITAYSISLDIITEVTAAPGRDCDFVFLHLNQDLNDTGYNRITIKVFLDDLNLLHARLNLLVDDLQAEEPMELSELIASLTNLAKDERDQRSPSVGSWEEVSSNTPYDDGTVTGRPVSRRHIDQHQRQDRTGRRETAKFQLPAHPVIYEPEDMQRRVAERHFEISAKACFHVLFGDKSFVFPKLYFDRRAQQIAQGPWESCDGNKLQRTFKFTANGMDILGRSKTADVVDHQVIDVFADHVTYVVTYTKTPWHLPHNQDFKLVTKVVVTHLAKSKSKLAIYTRVDWSKKPKFSKALVERQALDDAEQDAEELAEVATDQVRKLGPHSRTKRAIQVYGNIGQQTQTILFTPSEATELTKRPQIKPRTLTAMAFDTLRSFADSVATSLVLWAFAAVKKFFQVVTAHRVLIIMLVLSGLTNLVFTSKDSWSWWAERRAAKFMSRVGVGPNVMMSKAIYLEDLQEATQGGLAHYSVPQESSCYTTFQAIANTTDIDGPHEDAGSSLTSTSSKVTARRLRRTRQKLGAYRHDLVVAMRVVNRIEQEVVQSEWENWLEDENLRCEQVKMVLDGSVDSKKSKAAKAVRSEPAQTVMEPADEKRKEMLRRWHADYCGSCSEDHRALLRERGSISVI